MVRCAVPPGVVTATVTAPAEPLGAVAVICVELFTTKLAAVPPKVTELALERFEPVMITFGVVVPATPFEGLTELMVGGAAKVKALDSVLLP